MDKSRPSNVKCIGQVKVILYEVKVYDSKRSFLIDKNRHRAGTDYTYPRYGFLLKRARKFRKPLVVRGKLGFFTVEYEG